MAEPDNREVFRRSYEGAWNDGDLAVVDAPLADGFVNHALPEADPRPHVQAYKDGIRETREAFPDFGIVIDGMICEGDMVAARWYSSGTHTGRETSNRRHGVRTQGITMVRVAGGRISDLWKTGRRPHRPPATRPRVTAGGRGSRLLS